LHRTGGRPRDRPWPILLILGLLLGVGILYTIGIILIVVGAVLWLLGSMDRGFGGRRHYW